MFGNCVAFPILGFPTVLRDSTSTFSVFPTGFLLVTYKPSFDSVSTTSSLSVPPAQFFLNILAASEYYRLSLPHTQRSCHMSEIQACSNPRGDISNCNLLFFPRF